ncbi:MAG: phosphopantetheine-binding protein [Candidatus Uhrbacteria bacterium]
MKGKGVRNPWHSTRKERQMASEDTIERVREIVSRNFGVALYKIYPETSLVDDLNADEIDVTELLADIKKEFDFKVPGPGNEAGHGRLATIIDFADYVDNHL